MRDKAVREVIKELDQMRRAAEERSSAAGHGTAGHFYSDGKVGGYWRSMQALEQAMRVDKARCKAKRNGRTS